MEYLEHLVGMPQPTISDAHALGCGGLQAALRLRLRLHGVNHNTPSPMALPSHARETTGG